MTKIKCNKYQQPIIGTSSLATCDCDACAIPTRKDQEKLREQVTRALIYRQNKEIYKLNKIRTGLEQEKKNASSK